MLCTPASPCKQAISIITTCGPPYSAGMIPPIHQVRPLDSPSCEHPHTQCTGSSNPTLSTSDQLCTTTLSTSQQLPGKRQQLLGTQHYPQYDNRRVRYATHTTQPASRVGGHINCHKPHGLALHAPSAPPSQPAHSPSQALDTDCSQTSCNQQPGQLQRRC